MSSSSSPHKSAKPKRCGDGLRPSRSPLVVDVVVVGRAIMWDYGQCVGLMLAGESLRSWSNAHSAGSKHRQIQKRREGSGIGALSPSRHIIWGQFWPAGVADLTTGLKFLK